MRAKRAEKLLNPNQPTERLGLIFIQQIAHDLRAIWRPTPNDDYGLDGELEFTRDGVVTGFIVKVQVKSGPTFGLAPYGLAVPKGSGLDKPVLAALEKLMANGTYDSILKKWQIQSAAITKPGVNGAIS